MINALLIGGKGTIGSGLRTYLPKLDEEYRLTSIDLPGAVDKASDPLAQRDFIDCDVSKDDEILRQALIGRDLVIYLARKDPLSDMNTMTDKVFNAIIEVCPQAMVIGSSSVHSTGAVSYTHLRAHET